MTTLPIAQPTPTLRWCDDALELLDQRVLPMTVRYERCGTGAEVATAIRQMVVRGAPAIGCAAAYGIALAAREPQARTDIDKAIADADRLLRASRPTAVNLFWALDRMARALARAHALGLDRIALAGQLLDEARQIEAEDLAANQALGAWGATLLPTGARVMTHCNAGALATAGHGTALGVIRSARAAGNPVTVIANETRPWLQGARLTAWELHRDGIPVTLITDNMAGHLMRLGEVDAVIVGADRIAANGDTANKIGTYSLAVLAARHRIAFHVAAPMSTIDFDIAEGDRIPIEERAPDEVTGYRDTRWAPEGVRVRNPAFDVTPAELISSIITERGIARAPFATNLSGLRGAQDPQTRAQAPHPPERP
jgi:methylthioribose-1-phosphate isomerase